MLLPSAVPLDEVLKHEIAEGNVFFGRAVLQLALEHGQDEFTVAVGLFDPFLNEWCELHCLLASQAAIMGDVAA